MKILSPIKQKNAQKDVSLCDKFPCQQYITKRLTPRKERDGE